MLDPEQRERASEEESERGTYRRSGTVDKEGEPRLPNCDGVAEQSESREPRRSHGGARSRAQAGNLGFPGERGIPETERKSRSTRTIGGGIERRIRRSLGGVRHDQRKPAHGGACDGDSVAMGSPAGEEERGIDAS